MFKKLIQKVIHSAQNSGHHKHSSSHRGRRGNAHYSSSGKKRMSYRYSSSGYRPKRGSSSDYRHGSGHKGHKYYKNRYGSSS
ncbi:hypothetical protein C2I18_23265 [Paenibacillus sp. PK3_47]|uniref:hypothetical protein n=1 Tax=Paenibacillus sp. PK3_47 TaxID=2072642 RepID=UPI00201E1145|nr:hypothetical protein [Paenibacillus sp. PK3_47]UQZ36184.1 hypothetical protein C2I18_23265 [Paenibacillus sp. PK3_47]